MRLLTCSRPWWSTCKSRYQFERERKRIRRVGTRVCVPWLALYMSKNELKSFWFRRVALRDIIVRRDSNPPICRSARISSTLMPTL